MPISIKKDVKPISGFGASFSLLNTPVFDGKGKQTGALVRSAKGSYLKAVKPGVAYQNFHQFWKSWDIANAERDMTMEIAKHFQLREVDIPAYKDLWTISRSARNWMKDEKAKIEKDTEDAYKFAAQIAFGQTVNKPTFDRVKTRADANLVVFSDLHMTAFTNKKNFFRDFNLTVYLEVLNYYSKTDFCLVENGDVEECVLYEPTAADAATRKNQAPDSSSFPITESNTKWSSFLATRYARRLTTLNSVIAAFPDYYNAIRGFIGRNKYVRLAGNHDTYLAAGRERALKDRIEAVLGTSIQDILCVQRNGVNKYLIMHGHQFDGNCQQHGSTPYAKSLGEVFSECVAWAFQGPDRAWTTQDTKRWYIGNSFRNILAKETPGTYQNGTKGAGDLLLENVERIQEDSKDFVETILGHEIAWEYFENSDAFQALALEVLTGDEMYKLRHTNEVNLCSRYGAEFMNLQGPPFARQVPTVVLGHTHEPRQNAMDPNSLNTTYYYLNSGSAGRFENLIWCVEILQNEDRIVSWSKVDGKLKKIIWKSQLISTVIPRVGIIPERVVKTSTLVHDRIEWITV